MDYHEDIDLILVEESAAHQEKATVVIRYQNEQEVPDQGKMHLALDIDLPKIVGLGGLKTLDRLDGGRAV